jgi:hypothetical protein
VPDMDGPLLVFRQGACCTHRSTGGFPCRKHLFQLHCANRLFGPPAASQTDLFSGGPALQPASAQPTIDTLGDSLPPGLEHHVVAHVGEELSLSAVRASSRPYFFLGVRAVLLGS